MPGRSPRPASVAHALEITARAITCAALIMVSVFAALVVGDNVVMTLLGTHAWWTPRRLDRLLPHIDAEGEGGGQGVSTAADR